MKTKKTKNYFSRPVSLIIFVGFIIFVLSVVQITVANRLSTTGIELAKLQNKIEEYKKENALLQEEVLKKSSLTNIAQAADKEGFVVPQNSFVISTPLPLALNQ